MLRNTTEIPQKCPQKYSTAEIKNFLSSFWDGTRDMFGPSNTMTMKVISMKEDGEEWMGENRVITEMVYWDMVGQ